jgi:LAO/AO transport system kinase
VKVCYQRFYTEAAGYEIILVETVGVGQSETAAENVTDMFVLVAPPAGGDELQGIKKGIMEMVDLVVVNKADGPLLEVARRAAADYKTAVHLSQPKSPNWSPKVTTCSAAEKKNFEKVWGIMKDFWQSSQVEVVLSEQY